MGAVLALVAATGMVAAQPVSPTKTGAAPKPSKPLPLPAALPAADPIPPAGLADRPRVAVVNLSDLRDHADFRQLAEALDDAIARRPELAQVDRDVAAALIGAETNEDRTIKEARRNLDDARRSMGQFDLKAAKLWAEAGRDRLLQVTPTPALTSGLLADLVFALGEVNFRGTKNAEAKLYFSLVHRLAPGRTLDGAVHAPELIRTFAAAKTPPNGVATVRVNATGTVWLDGQPHGKGTQTLTVVPGPHVIIVSDPDISPEGRTFDAVAGQTIAFTIESRRVQSDLRAARARHALMAAADEAARTAAMAEIKDLANLQAAVIVTADAKGAAAVQLWRTKGFGNIETVQRPLPNDKADALIAPLVPPRKIDLRPKDIGKKYEIPPPPKPWYRKRWVQVVIGSGLLGTIAAGIAISRSGADSRPVDGISAGDGEARDPR